MGSGAGRGKFKGKPTGRRQFSTVEEMAAGTSSEPKWRMRRQEEEAGSEEEEEEEEEEQEEGEEEEEKAKGVSGLIQTANPNAPTKASIKVRDATGSGPELSRREREELAKQQAQERYMKLQEQGKTEQAKKDLERLAMIRQQRAEAAKKREEEKLAREAKKSDARK